MVFSQPYRGGLLGGGVLELKQPKIPRALLLSISNKSHFSGMLATDARPTAKAKTSRSPKPKVVEPSESEENETWSRFA